MFNKKRLESAKKNYGKILQLDRKYGLIPLVVYLRFKVHLSQSMIKTLSKIS